MKTFDGIAYVIKKVEETEHKSRLNPPISSYIRLCSNISMLISASHRISISLKTSQ